MEANTIKTIGMGIAVIKLITPFLAPILSCLGGILVTKVINAHSIEKLKQTLLYAMDEIEFRDNIEKEHIANNKHIHGQGFGMAMRNNVRAFTKTNTTNKFSPSKINQIREQYKNKKKSN